MKTTLAIVLTFAAALGLAPATASARHPNRFDGTCRLSGELVFGTPLGYETHATSVRDSASGTCTGRLNGVSVHAIRTVNRVSGSARASCASGTAHTLDTLIFARRTRIVIHTDSVFAATQGVAHTVGAVSGHSVEHVNPLPYLGPPTLAACQAGALRRARYDLDARTIGALVG